MSEELESSEKPISERKIAGTSEIDSVRSALSRARKLNVFLGFSLVLALIVAIKTSGTVISTIVPSTTKQTFWVTTDRVSPEYLEEMGLYVASLAKSFTPETIGYNHKQLLKIASPEYFGALQKKLANSSNYVKQNNLSSVFRPNSAKINQVNMSIVVSGVLNQYVNDDPLKAEQVSYRIWFGYENGFISLKGIEPVE